MILATILTVTACDSKGDKEAAETDDQREPAPAAGSRAEGAPSGEKADEPSPPPAEDRGTIVYAGNTTEVSGDDFDICETVNPAFKGDFNIVTKLEDGTRLKLLGNIDDHSADHQGLILGDMPDEEKATDLQLSLEGRTLSGSAKTEAGPIEFRFEC